MHTFATTRGLLIQKVNSTSYWGLLIGNVHFQFPSMAPKRHLLKSSTNNKRTPQYRTEVENENKEHFLNVIQAGSVVILRAPSLIISPELDHESRGNLYESRGNLLVIFEPGTATGSELFSSLTCLHTTTLKLLSIFFTCRDDKRGNLEGANVLACEMSTSSFCPWLKTVAR